MGGDRELCRKAETGLPSLEVSLPSACGRTGGDVFERLVVGRRYRNEDTSFGSDLA